MLDATDLRILRCLQERPDISVVELAAAVGLSHTPCWRRVKQLEASGIIQSRATILNPRSLGFGINVFANVRLKTHDEETLEALERAALDEPAIIECYSMSGESDYIFRILVRDIDEYERFLKKTLLHLPGVASINSHFALKCVKQTTKLPI